MPSSIPSVCINLNRRPDRLQHFTQQIQNHVNYILFPAIDGEKLEEYKQNLFLSPYLQLVEGREVVLGEIGCSLSHLSVLNLFVNQKTDIPYCIIFEDDIMLNDGKTFHGLEEELTQIPFDWDIVYIGGQWTPQYGIDSECYIDDHKITSNHIGTVFSQIRNSSIYERTEDDMCKWDSPYFRTAGAYVVNTNSVKRLVNIINHNKQWFISTPWDMWLLQLQKHGLIRTLDYLPHLCYQGGFELSNLTCLLKNDIHRGVLQKFNSSIFENFIFVPNRDVMDHDMYKVNHTPLPTLLQLALDDDSCVAVNTLGYFKRKIDLLIESPYLGVNDGVYIKKKSCHRITYILIADTLEAIMNLQNIHKRIDNSILHHVIVVFNGKYVDRGTDMWWCNESNVTIFNYDKQNYMFDTFKKHINDAVVVCVNVSGIVHIDSEMFKDSYCSSNILHFHGMCEHVFLFKTNKRFIELIDGNVCTDMSKLPNVLIDYIKKDDTHSQFSIDTFVTYDTPKYTVQFTGNYWENSHAMYNEFKLLCHTSNIFRNIELVTNNRPNYWVIINEPSLHDEPFINFEKALYFCLEPTNFWQEWLNSKKDVLAYVHDRNTRLNAGQWRMNVPHFIMSSRINHERENKVASILSNTQLFPGHTSRIELIQHIDSCDPLILAVYGRENYHDLRSYVGPIDKYEQYSVLKQYKYYLLPENTSISNYVTEKFWEPIICECLCFYWGCPNLELTFGDGCFIRLDINDKEQSLNTIRSAIEGGEWEKKIDRIRQVKQQVLDQHSILSIINTKITEKQT